MKNFLLILLLAFPVFSDKADSLFIEYFKDLPVHAVVIFGFEVAEKRGMTGISGRAVSLYQDIEGMILVKGTPRSRSLFARMPETKEKVIFLNAYEEHFKNGATYYKPIRVSRNLLKKSKKLLEQIIQELKYEEF